MTSEEELDPEFKSWLLDREIVEKRYNNLINEIQITRMELKVGNAENNKLLMKIIEVLSIIANQLDYYPGDKQ